MKTAAELVLQPPAPAHDHDWEPCFTPPDSASRWYRCAVDGCGIFAYKRNLAIVPYRCTEKGCKAPAIERLRGRGPRSSYLWKCRTHLHADDEVAT